MKTKPKPVSPGRAAFEEFWKHVGLASYDRWSNSTPWCRKAWRAAARAAIQAHQQKTKP